MSVYSRKLYDHCDLVEQDRMSKMPGNYRLSKQPVSQKRRSAPLTGGLANDSYFNPETKEYVGSFVELDSHLRGIDVIQSRCTKGRTLNDLNARAKTIRDKLPQINGLADSRLMSSYTRMEQPAIDLRSATISRFDFPITDPRKQVYYGTPGTNQMGDLRGGINSRMDVRDSVNMNDYLANIDAGPPKF